VEEGGWSFSVPPAGQRLASPEPLFAKVDDKVIDEENNRLEQGVLTPG